MFKTSQWGSKKGNLKTTQHIKQVQQEQGSTKSIDWKQIGRFISVIVKLFSNISEIFKKHQLGPEILDWITGSGKEIFENEFLIPLAVRSSCVRSRFKDWHEICRIDDWNLRMALARVDMASDMGHKLQRAFPECFTDTETQGPIPLSVLKEEASRRSQEDYRASHYRWWVDLDIAKDYNIPFTRIYVLDDEGQGNRKGLPQLRDEDITDGMVDFGEIVTYKRQKYLVIEDNGDTVCLSPVECFDLSK